MDTCKLIAYDDSHRKKRVPLGSQTTSTITVLDLCDHVRAAFGFEGYTVKQMDDRKYTYSLIKGKQLRGEDLQAFMCWWREGDERRVGKFYNVMTLVDLCLERIRDGVKGRVHFEIEF